MTNILAIDYGAKRIGLAVNNMLGVVSPLDFVKNDSGKLAGLKQIIRERNIQKIILGLPIALSGQEELAAQKVRKFAGELTALGLPVEFIDERLSTVEAHKRMLQYGISAKNRRPLADSLSAGILLEKYLQYAAKK
ncbi:MAG: Holliday junction resolvase RuvX [Candidatus Margulisbacteria bacterium]|jgi:putative Holliday junction resolvase|nr:Holliday junction resolvase RuvX [Candidatus Margulisiibacteriota bacterium]